MKQKAELATAGVEQTNKKQSIKMKKQSTKTTEN